MMEMMAKAPFADRRPTHPGELLREDVLPALGITATAAAGFLGVSRQALHKLMTEQVAMTPEMAARVGKLCGNSPEMWLGMQSRLDLWTTKRLLAAELACIPTNPVPAEKRRVAKPLAAKQAAVKPKTAVPKRPAPEKVVARKAAKAVRPRKKPAKMEPHVEKRVAV